MRKLKILSLLLAVAFVLSGTHTAYANRIGLKPTAQAGGFKTWTLDMSTTLHGAHNASASTNPAGTTTYIENTSVVGKGSVLYGFSVIAETAAAEVAIYDSLSALTVSTTTYKTLLVDEIREATQHITRYSDWVAPKMLENGFTVLSNPTVASTVIVYYD